MQNPIPLWFWGGLSDPNTAGQAAPEQQHAATASPAQIPRESSPQAHQASLEEIPSPYAKCKTQTVFMLEQAANFVTKFHRSIGINVTF